MSRYFINLNDVNKTRLNLNSVNEYYYSETYDQTGHILKKCGLVINSKYYEYADKKFCLKDINKLDRFFAFTDR